MSWYKNGTVAVTTGATFVTGTGTRFASNSRVGDAFRGPDGDWYEVVNIASETVIGIYPEYAGASISGSNDYTIAPIQGYNKETADRLRAVTDQIRDFDVEIQRAKDEADRSTASADAAHLSETASKTSEVNAKASENASKTSETNAANSANIAENARDAAVIAKDAAEAAAGSVVGNLNDLGPWDASTGVYPPTQPVSTFWKVTGSGEATFNSKTIEYAIGDTLVWSKPLNEFYKIDNTESVGSVNGKKGVVVLTPTDIGLGNVDNTSDLNKPISTATQTALNGKANLTTSNNTVPISQGGTGSNTAESARAALNVAEVDTSYITGIIPSRPTNNSLVFSTGTAYVPGLSRRVTITSAITLSGLALTAATWYYAYLYDNAGVAAVELVTTAPSTAYMGTARTKTGDTTRRFIGSFKSTNAGGVGVLGFVCTMDGFITYNDNMIVSPYRILPAGAATSTTAVSAAGVVPLTTRSVKVNLTNNGTPVGGITAPTFNVYLCAQPAGGRGVYNTFVDDNLSIWYMNGGGGGAITLDVVGYGNDR